MKDEQPKDLRVRTKCFALDVVRLYSALPKTTAALVYRESHATEEIIETYARIPLEGGALSPPCGR